MKRLCLLLFLGISFGVPSQIDGQEDRSSIEKTIRIYFDSMHESSKAKVDLASVSYTHLTLPTILLV